MLIVLAVLTVLTVLTQTPAPFRVIRSEGWGHSSAAMAPPSIAQKRGLRSTQTVSPRNFSVSTGATIR
jgi:hypothetical protein